MYPMVIATVSRETLPMQDSVCCDYFRTPVIFQVVDISEMFVATSLLVRSLLKSYAMQQYIFITIMTSQL